MNDRITAGASALMASLAGCAGIVRAWPAPGGRHRAARPLLLPDEPVPARTGPVPHAVLDEDELGRLLNEGELEPLECAPCPCCDRTTAHAMQRDGSRRCWTCGTVTAGAA